MEAVVQSRTIWRGAVLKSVSMRAINTVDADFRDADLRDCTISQAYMNNTDFSGADLRGAEFRTSAFDNANFTGADLRNLLYDPVALQYLAMSRLDGAKMSANLESDLKKLRSGAA